MTAQFSKLSDGSWGVRVFGRCPTIGERLSVSRKDGSSTTAIVASIVSRTPQHTTCAIEAKRGKRGAAASSSRWQGKRGAGVTFAVAPDAVPLEIDWDAERDAEERAAITRESQAEFGAYPFGADDPALEQADRALDRMTAATDPFLWAAFADYADDWSR